VPPAPVPTELQRFLAAPRPAVVGTLTASGAPATTPCWYLWTEDGRIMLSMDRAGRRQANLRRDPRLSLTVLGDSWYDQVSLVGRAVEFREDTDLADMARLAEHYGLPLDHDYRGVTVVAEVDRWTVYGHLSSTAR
jgi:PPOX class probable F420-dependent enzyme